jgi:hypothetical protein
VTRAVPADLPEEQTEVPVGGVIVPNGEALLDEVQAFLQRFVAYPNPEAAVAHSLWIAHTWLMDVWESTPRIAFLSPEPGSGKSRALEVTEPLVPRPIHAVNTTPAYLFRKVSDEAGEPTILYDEIDTVFGPKAKDNEDIRGMLNAGHRKGATAGRCTSRDGVIVTEELPAYCAVALAGLDDLPDTIMSRSIVVRMRRRAPHERVEPWRLRVNGAEAQRLSNRIAAWADSVSTGLAGGDYWPEMPAGIEDRDADVWEALLAVADLAGGHWPTTARDAAVTAVTASKERPLSLGVLLLADVRTVFDSVSSERLGTEVLLNGLADLDESPWATIRKGEALDSRGLSFRLQKYGIGPKAHKVNGEVFKGYSRAQFEDAWSRYLPPVSDSAVTPVTPVTPQVNTPDWVTDPSAEVTGVTDSDSGVTDRSEKKLPLTSEVTEVTAVTDKSEALHPVGGFDPWGDEVQWEEPDWEAPPTIRDPFEGIEPEEPVAS